MEKKNVSITLYKNELLYDVQNRTHHISESVQGAGMNGADDHESAYKLQVSDLPPEENEIIRSMDLTFSHCVELCYPFTKEDVSDKRTVDDQRTRSGSYVMRLSVPSSFSETTLTYIERQVHEMMVCQAIADWMKLVDAPRAAVWLSCAESAEDNITRSLSYRTGKTRRPLTPF